MSDTKSRKFLGIQALRIIAACLVVVTHSTYYAFERLDKHFPVWERGTRGVDIFFVISGFVMIYASQKLFSTSDGWKVFAEHRIVRIVPLYWLVTTFKVVILLATAGLALHTALSPRTAICSYLFLPTKDLDGKLEPLVGVGWTLNFEMLFYFFFALALFLRANVFKFVGVVLVLLSIGGYFRQPSWPAAAFYLNSIVLEFYFGMLIAKACINNMYIPKKLAYLLLALGFFLLLLPPFDWNVLPKFLVSGVPAAMIVWSTASLEGLGNAIPAFILYLGDASYSIYLIHPFVSPLPPAVLSRVHFHHPVISVICSVALGIGAGCILHQLVEKPMTTRMRDYLRARRAPVRVPA